LYKSEGDFARTIEVAQAGIQAFPKYGGTYLVLGQVAYEQNDFETARQNLEYSVQLDKYNYMALKLLAEAYLHLGRFGDAVKRLEDILYFAPGDEVINKMLEEARRAAGVKPAVAEKPAPAPAKSAEPQEARASRPTVEKKKAPEPRAQQVVGVREENLDSGIAALSEIKGVHGALLVDAYGLVVAAHLGNIDEGLAGALITNVYRIASQNSPYMGIGEFEGGLIEGEAGNIHLLLLEDMILAVFADASLRLGLLEKKIREFAESIIEV
jgi:predicted regulator of Ras-like GTPase activity (Roadblock/LC7/MglB family)